MRTGRVEGVEGAVVTPTSLSGLRSRLRWAFVVTSIQSVLLSEHNSEYYPSLESWCMVLSSVFFELGSGESTAWPPSAGEPGMEREA